MGIKNIIKIVILVIIVGLLVFFTINYVNKQNNRTIENFYLSEMLVFKDGHEYEILLSNSDKSTWFRIDDEKEQFYSYPREGNSRIKIPKMEEIESENVLFKLRPLSNYTYDVDMDNGFKYLKYLLEDGYEIKMYVVTSTYYEAFLERDGNLKRIVLFSDFMMAGDMVDGAELPQLYDYFTTYNFNDYIVNKLQVLE